MKLIRHLSGAANLPAQRCILALGAFDGVHIGHQMLIREMKTRANQLSRPTAVLSFEPLPREYFRQPGFLRLTRIREKLVLLANMGIDFTLLAKFNQDFTQLNPEQFIDLMVKKLAPEEIWVGADFRFGHQRAGSVATLEANAARYGYRCVVVGDVLHDQARVSASAIRALLIQGNVPDANAKLARCFSYSGRVVQGQQLARTLGFPTANLLWLDAPTALYGVYAVRVYGKGFKSVPAVASLGMRPVVQGSACWLEVHLFDFDGDLYGQRLRVDFIKKLRPEQNFDGLAALVAQVNIDITQAKAALDEL